MEQTDRKKLLTEIMEADAKDGLYHIVDTNKMVTAVEWFIDRIKNQHLYGFTPLHELEEQAKAMEKEQIIDAMMHSLDEDGHTGDWKIKFVNDYYNKTFKS